MDAIQTQREIINLTLKLQNELLAHGDSLPVSSRNILTSNHQMLINMITSLPLPRSAPVHAHAPAPPAAPVSAASSDSEPDSPDEVMDWDAEEEAALAKLEAMISKT